ncbi:sensor histidine kinase [Abyssisolibacter fermentans]|uniref:sensor histidine kinase n=1 Tax=Abyssisolibacter fermentans TaxID=1766203 RepID=UPI00138EFE42|nr:histidine kinase [Abyssisolibacter fermentans]
MKKFTDIKIRGQIRFIVIIVAIILVFSAFVILYFIAEILVDRNKAYYEANTSVVEANISTMLNSIKINNNNYSYVLEISETLTSETVEKNKLEDYFINGYAKFNSFFHETMEGIILYPMNGEKIIVGKEDLVNRVFNKTKEQYDFDNNSYQKTFFTESIFDENTNEYYFACVSPIYEADNIEPQGYFISIINYDFVSNILKINKEKEIDTIILLLEDNKIITNNKEISIEVSEKIMKYIDKDRILDEYISIKNTEHIYFEKNIKNTYWKIITLVPKKKIQRNAGSIRPIFVVIGVISIVILSFVSRKIISAITRPVEQIVEKLDEYETSEDYEDIETPLKNEISEIAMHINEMMHKVKNSNKKLLDTQKTLFQLEIAMVQAELSYYQSQINPHFLYNTLECIRSLATFHDAPEIEKLSLAMSKIFRYAVREETIVTLEDELKCVGEYSNVMTLRFPEKYEYIVDIDEYIKEIPITKMTLQPIVENSFKYGITNKKKKGKIYIKNKKGNNCVNIEIIDTGKGIAKDKLCEINEYLLKDEDKDLTNHNSARLGLKNINKRIKLCFGKEYGIKIESIEGYYTKVILMLPPRNK